MKIVLIFLFWFACCCGLAWIGGYNFDERGFMVAYATLLGLVASAGVTAITCSFIEGRS